MADAQSVPDLGSQGQLGGGAPLLKWAEVHRGQSSITGQPGAPCSLLGGDPEAWRHREEAGQQQLHILGDGAQAGDQLGGEALVDCGDEELVPVVVLHLEGQPAGEHAVEADTQGPHVHGLAVGHRLVVDLRSSVLGRSTASLELGAWVPEVAQPEVSNDGFGVILVQQDVFELDVSVNDLLGVEVADSR